jgi:hypothetical protein
LRCFGTFRLHCQRCYWSAVIMKLKSKIMKKLSILIAGIISITLLGGCDDNPTKNSEVPSGVDTSQASVMSQVATQRVGYINFEAEIVNQAGTIPNEEKTVILLTLDNHRSDLSAFDYENIAQLNDAQAEAWEIESIERGGHHTSGVLTFPYIENPQRLKITGLPVGETILIFNTP